MTQFSTEVRDERCYEGAETQGVGPLADLETQDMYVRVGKETRDVCFRVGLGAWDERDSEEVEMLSVEYRVMTGVKGGERQGQGV